MRAPTVEWQVAGACNYDCSYCIQSPRYRRGRPDAAQLDRAIDTFAALPGTWELKCSGGEAFAHPLFLDVVIPGLMARTPHRLSILTNFSAPPEELDRFVGLVEDRLEVFSASLHPEFADVDRFVEKARWFVARAPTARFVVNQVVLPTRLEEAAACKGKVEAGGLRWFPQLYKVDGGVAEYPVGIEALIGAEPGPREANVAPSYRGRRCWAGGDYLTATPAPDVLARFAALTALRPGLISASFHLEYADPAAFRDKVEALRSVHRGTLCVTCVATRDNLPLLPALRELFAPVAFRVQPEKLDRDVIDYTEAEVDELTALGGHNGIGDIAPSYEGQLCWAGARYLIVDHRGEVYRCYPARRRREERLGNLLDGSFRPRFAAGPCRYTYCSCTVPRQRGMVHGDR